MTALTIQTAGATPLTDLQRRILAHCIASEGPKASGCTVTPVGVVCPTSEAARAVYGSLVYDYGITIFTAFVTGKVGKRKYDGIAEFVDSFATQIEIALGLKKGDLAQPVKLVITHQ